MKENNKVGIVLVRLGEFDNYIDFWLKSASANTKIDFLIFTDNDAFLKKHSNIENVKIFSITAEEFKKRLSKIVSSEISLNNPYKLCDYKPSYGLVFSKELKDYDYWGFCDTDLIFGDIYDFIKNKLYHYDRLYDLGHFNLFRNSEEISSVFLKTLENTDHLTFDMATKEDENIYFDEFFGLNIIWDNHLEYKQYKNSKDYADINVYSYRLKRTDSKSAFYYEWKNGKLYEKDNNHSREIMYVHLQKRNIKTGSSTPDMPFSIINTKISNTIGEKAKTIYNKSHYMKSLFYQMKKKIKYYLGRYKRKKYIKKKAKTDFYKICY